MVQCGLPLCGVVSIVCKHVHCRTGYLFFIETFWIVYKPVEYGLGKLCIVQLVAKSYSDPCVQHVGLQRSFV